MNKNTTLNFGIVLDLEYPQKKCSGDFPLMRWQTFILLKVITALKIFTSLISQKSKKLAACSS
jgi:hypothetical protein